MKIHKEYFIVANSFAAPFFSDRSNEYIKARNPKEALKKFAAQYKHPCGLYCANCYASADDYHKGKDFLAQWLSNHEQAKQKATKDLGGYSYLGERPGKFKINEDWIEVENPKAGSVV